MINKEIIQELIQDQKYIVFSFEELIKDINTNIVFKESIKCIELYDYEGIERAKEYINDNINNNIDTLNDIEVHICDVHICTIKISLLDKDIKISLIIIDYIRNIYKNIIKLNLTKAYQEIVLNSLPKGMLLLNNEGVVQFINYEGADILGVSKKDSIGVHVSELVDFKPIILNVFETGKGYKNKEISIESKDKQIHFIKSAVPIKNKNGVVIGVVDTFERIKDVKKVVNRINGAYAKFEFNDMIGDSEKFLECIRMAKIASKSSSNVLIYGESGTGKELCAHAIHNESSRYKYPFISINCAAIPRDLLESELFGYEEGSFTGALKKGKAGKFELAHKGSIFLDEIGDMPLDMQVKLLRVLQDRKINRIGSNHTLEIDVRIICATNKNLFKLCEDGFFRKDLYYRLNVLNIVLTPLRDRIDDIEKLSYFFLNKFNNKLKKNIERIEQEVFKLFYEYSWPGNVRELENIIERGVNICQGDEISINHIDNDIFKKKIITNNQCIDLENYRNIDKITSSKQKLKTIAELEKDAIEQALTTYNGNISEAAKVLGITRNTIYNKMKKFIDIK